MKLTKPFGTHHLFIAEEGCNIVNLNYVINTMNDGSVIGGGGGDKMKGGVT